MSNRQQSRGNRGRGQTRGHFGRGRGGHVDVEVFSHDDNATIKPNSRVEVAENRKLTSAAVPSNTSGVKMVQVAQSLPPRPGYGTQGRPILLWANYFQMESTYDLLLHRYSIKISSDRGPAPTGKKAKRVVQLLVEEHFSDVQHNITTDFKSNLICSSDLKINDGAFLVRYRTEGEDDPAENAPTYQIRIQPTGTLRVGELMDYLTSTNSSTTSGSSNEIVQAMNIIVGHRPKTDPLIFSIGANKNFEINAAHSERINLGAGLSAIRGFFFSVRAATARMLLNVHVKHTTCYNEGPLGQLMTAYLDSNGPNMLKLQNFLKKVRVQVIHIVRRNRKGAQIPRIKTIYGLATPGDGQGLEQAPVIPRFAAGPKEVRFYQVHSSRTGNLFERKTSAQSDATQQVSDYIDVFEFFRRTYHVTISDPRLPVINVGTRQNPSYLPVDVCQVLPGQTSRVKLTPRQTQQMIKFAVRKPIQNATSIVTNGSRILGMQPSDNVTLTRFGLHIEPKLIVVPGRVLNGPNVTYRGGRSILTNHGGWNMQSIQFNQSPSLGTWTYLNVSLNGLRQRMHVDQEFTQYMEMFRNKLSEVGIDPRAYVPGFSIISDSANVEDDVETTIGNFFGNQQRPPPRLLLVILPNNNSAIYNRVKYVCDVKRGIRNICVVGPKFGKEPNHQYFANVALKVNLKLGGRNQSLNPSKLGIIGEGKSMVVGLDVTHPSPGSAANAPSVAGIVALIDSALSQWPADIRIQPTARKEMVVDLAELMESRLRLWQAGNKAYPENIVIYRDGVSEGQYNLVLEQELPAIRRACEGLYPATLTKQGFPRLSIIIVGKRHNTRFYPTSKDDADRSANPPNGTVVDRGVTESHNWDFFLQAHSALQGTARPAHYYVVLDEIFRRHKLVPPLQNAAEALEDLTHNMCYLFGRATKAVSICPAAYYADLVCERARCYLSGLFDPSTPEGSDSGSIGVSGRVGPELSDVRIHDNVKDSMFYI